MGKGFGGQGNFIAQSQNTDLRHKKTPAKAGVLKNRKAKKLTLRELWTTTCFA